MKKFIFPVLIFSFLLFGMEIVEAAKNSNPYYKNWIRQYQKGKYPRIGLRSTSYSKYKNLNKRFSGSAMKNLFERKITLEEHQAAIESSSAKASEGREETFRSSAPRRTTKRYGSFNKLRKEKSKLFWPRAVPKFEGKKSLDPRAKIYWQDDSLSANINLVRKPGAILAIDPNPVPLFELGFYWPRYTNSINFPRAVLLEELKFKIIENKGLVNDFRNFQLNIDDESYEFEKDGTLTLRLQNARIAQGRNLNLDIDIAIKDPDVLPHIPGNLRVKLMDTKAVAEGTRVPVKIKTKGSKTSHFVQWDPIPRVSGDTSFLGTATKIQGKTLMAGTKATVLTLNLEAHYDDLLIDQVTVTEEFTSQSIDTWVKKIRAIDLSDGRILGETRFVAGLAKFRFWSPFRVNRGQLKRLAFEIELADQVDITSQSTKFKLGVLPENVWVRGIGSGKNLPDANKTFSSQTETFFVVNSALQVYHSELQPDLVTHENLAGVYRFKVKNLGRKEVSIGRITMNIRLSDLEYPGGISPDDFELRSMYRGRVVLTGSNPFSVSTPSSTKIIFDATEEVQIDRSSEAEFELRIALKNPDSSKGDAVSIQILSDSELFVGTLDDLKTEGTNGQNFIWSDQSARPHTTETEDFLSGYKIFGLPTNTFVKKR